MVCIKDNFLLFENECRRKTRNGLLGRLLVALHQRRKSTSGE
jgi:hypothetical protein